MERIPLIIFDQKTIYSDQNNTQISLQTIIETTDSQTPLYIKDHHALQGGEPSFQYIQRLSKQRQLWLDAAPQNTEDVFDYILAGASVIIIRQNHWKKPFFYDALQEIKQHIENPLYLERSWEKLPHEIPDADGYIFLPGLPSQPNTIPPRYTFSSLSSTKPLYLYEPDPMKNTSSYSDSKNIGSIIDLANYTKVNE